MTAPVHPSPVLAELAKKAKSPQTGLFPGNEDPVGYWLTPPAMMQWLQAEFEFDADACPFPRPAGYDGTTAAWGGMTYCNPPFEGANRPGLTAWVKKAISENMAGNGSVLTFPMDGWVHMATDHGAILRSAGKHDWIDARTGAARPAGRPTMLIIFPKGGARRCAAIPGVKEEGCPLCANLRPAIEVGRGS